MFTISETGIFQRYEVPFEAMRRVSGVDFIKNLDIFKIERARAALKEAEEKYRQVSRDTDRKILKTLNDYYAGMYVLEYDRHPMMVGDGPVMKENFTITRIDKVTMVGNGFIQVKGKSVRYKTRDKFGIPHENTTKLEITTEKGTNLHISRVDRILTEKSLDKLLDKVRKHFFKQMGSIW